MEGYAEDADLGCVSLSVSTVGGIISEFGPVAKTMLGDEAWQLLAQEHAPYGCYKVPSILIGTAPLVIHLTLAEQGISDGSMLTIVFKEITIADTESIATTVLAGVQQLDIEDRYVWNHIKSLENVQGLNAICRFGFPGSGAARSRAACCLIQQSSGVC